MSQRFFVEAPIGTASTAQLSGAEAQHLTKVMRARLGDELLAFDGSGCEFLARISKLGKTSVDLEIVERREVNRELPHSLTLAVALPKGDRQKMLVEKLVELGATSLIPLETERSVAEGTPSALLRLRRQVIEASKQCGRNRLMSIGEPIDVAQLVGMSTSERRVLAHPSGGMLSTAMLAEPTTIAVGPEGGFTDEETSLAATAGWEVVSLGPRILRVETAALALAGIFGMSAN